MSLLSVENLSLTFRTPHHTVEAVKHISFAINEGEMLALVGESGSGKSLTALSCLGLQPESAQRTGTIIFNGVPVTGDLQTLRGKDISMIFQEPMTALNPLHTIAKQIGESLTIHNRMTPAEVKTRVLDLLDKVGLSYLKDRLGAYPHELSGGERQRVMIAMAIANSPKLLIADEPTTAVDVTVQTKILALLKELQASMNMAILFITHDLTIVKRLADRVCVMSQGEIVETATAKELFAAPKHAYTQHLLASEPKGDPAPIPADSPAIMSCKNLKVYFPIKKGLLKRTKAYIKAVDDVTITIPESSTLGIVGESGSGKTTLGFALLRLIKSEGLIVFLGQDINGLSRKAMYPLRDRMQVVFQDPFSSLNPRMTVEHIIGEGLKLHQPNLTEADYIGQINTILEEVGLTPEMKGRYPHEFSGGQRQRISIARAMILRPRFVVLDEPTSALDLTVQSQIIELLKKLQKDRGLSYMFISHDLRVVRAIAQRIIVMRKGVIVEEGDTKTLFLDPKNDYTRELINAAFLGD